MGPKSKYCTIRSICDPKHAAPNPRIESACTLFLPRPCLRKKSVQTLFGHIFLFRKKQSTQEGHGLDFYS